MVVARAYSCLEEDPFVDRKSQLIGFGGVLLPTNRDVNERTVGAPRFEIPTSSC